MTEKVNLPVRKFIEQKISDNFKDIDFRRGTAFNDLFAKPAAMLFQPFRHELNMLKINQSILNFDNMSTADVDLLIGNVFIRRAAAAKAIGTLRIYFRDPGIYRFDRIIFYTQGGLRFLNTSIINTTTESLLANRSDDGLYYIDILVEAESSGAQYSVKSGEITLIENQPSQILKVENIDDFGQVTDEEDNAQLYAKARRSISVRNLINDSSIQSVLFNQFTFIRDIFVVGAGDVQMIRDKLILPTVPPATIHIGGMTDIYIDTTGITAYELNINSIPETGVIDCVSSPEQAVLFKYESGVLDDTFFFDFNHKFFEGTAQLVSRGNKLKILTREFGVTKVREYNVEQVLEDNRVRISGGIEYTTLDGVVFDAGNIIYDFIQGQFNSTYGVAKGEYFSYGPGDAWKINNSFDASVEITPLDIIVLDLVFDIDIAIDGTSSVLNFFGIGGVLSTATEVKVNDILELVFSNAWGRYKVHERISDDEILIFPETATVATSSITFTGTDTFTGVAAVGSFITVRDTSPIDKQTYEVIAVGQVNRVHNQAATLNCVVSDKILLEDISVNTPFKIIRKRVKELVAPIAADALITPLSGGEYFFEVANTAQYKLGDEVLFAGNATPRLVVGIQNSATMKVQLDGTITTAQIATYTPSIYRYTVNQFTNPTVIFDRYNHTGTFQYDLAAGFTTINMPFVGINGWSGYKLIIHDGEAVGIYTIDASNAMNPDSVTLTAPVTKKITAGDTYSIIKGLPQVGSAHDDILYVPTFTNDLSAVSPSFPNSAVTHFINIVNGPNKGVYEVSEYLDANRVRINGTISVTGENVVTEQKFQNFTAEGSTSITEPGTPFTGATQYDTLIVNRSGTLSYHSIQSATANNLTINPALTDDIVGGNTQYTISHDTMNPFVITSQQTAFEIHNLPDISDRRSEGIHGNCTGTSYVFTDTDANFLDIFDGINPAGYEIYILEGTHARSEPYIIQSIGTPTTLIIDPSSYDDSSSDSPNFGASGFIGSSSPSGSEKYEIRKAVTLLSPNSYELVELYSYYEGEYFKLPILALRDITLIDPVTGELSTTPLAEPTDFTLGIRDASTRYSVIERPIIQFTDPNAFRYQKVRIRYYSDPNIKIVNDFCLDRANRITNNSTLVKRMESTFIEISISMEGNIEKQEAEDIINEYITTRKSQEPIEASDIIQKLYEAGITYVDTETLELKAIYYTSDGQRLDSVSRTRVVSASTATYIPGVITVNLIPTT